MAHTSFFFAASLIPSVWGRIGRKPHSGACGWNPCEV